MKDAQRKSLVKTFYSNRASRYDDDIGKHPVLSSIRDQLVKELYLRKGSLVLDLGCGSGITAFAIRSRFGNGMVVGVDIADPMVKVAKKHARSFDDTIEFLIGDMETISFKDSTFDLVLCINAIRYLESLKPALSEIYRVLGDDGRLILVDGDRECEEMRDKFARERILKKHPLERKFVSSDGWNMLYTKDKIRNELMEAHFENVTIESERMYLIARAQKK